MRSKIIFAIVFLLAGMEAFSQIPPEETFEAKVNQLVNSKVKPDDPGLAIAVLKNGKTVLKSSAGKSNLDYSIPVSAQTSFNIASNAKQFTAVCILLLEKDKLISLDDDFRKYTPAILKDYPGKITIGNLVNHTSGIRDVYDLWALQGKTWWQTFVGNDDALNLLKGQTTLNFKPGSRYLYSNSNYLILAEIIKTVTKTPLKDYAKKKIFEPLGMTQTGFVDNYMQVVPNRAEGYGNFSGWKKYPWITNVYGDGALFSTLDDQIKWEAHLFDPKLWNAAFNAKILQPLRIENQSFYGFGLMHEDYKGLRHAYHDGSTGAYNASLVRFPTENLAVVVVSNNAQLATREIALQTAELLIDKNKLSEIVNDLTQTNIADASTESEIPGDYQFDDGTIIHIKKDAAGIFRELYGRDPARLNKVGGAVYAYEGNEKLKMKFDLSDMRVAKSLTIYYPGQPPQTAVKLPPSEVSGDYFATINGRYMNEETGTFIEIKHKEASDYNLNKNDRTRLAKLVRKDYLRMNSYQVLIERDAAGAIAGLIVNNNRIINVKFKKVNQ